MKKIFSVLIIAALMSGVIAAKSEAKNLSVVATIFPIYDWVSEIAGEKADLTLLLDNGVDLHSYQPTVNDMVKISTCDIFIYVGGESDEWVEDALKNSTNKNQIALNLLDLLGSSVKHEEIVEGMQHEHEKHDHDHNHEDEHKEHEHEHEAELDEHIWLSLRNAMKICKKISEFLSSIAPENQEIYSLNTKIYLEKLERLDEEYKSVIENSKRKVFLFGDRFPFRYLADDYGLKYYAAFSGCSAETEASFETVIFLAKKTDELNLPCVLTIENSSRKIAETIINNTGGKNQSVLSLNSMQSETLNDIKNGENYLSIMEKNLETLKIALN